MKNVFFVIAVVAIFSLNACGQTSKDVPENIKTAFSQKFPNATKVKWDKENEKEWEAEFKMDGKECSVNFDNNGAILKEEINNKEDEEGEENEKNEKKCDHASCAMLFTDDFNTDSYTFSTAGRNRYFILEPGYQLILEGKDDDNTVRLEITVLDETRKIGNVNTRILEEKEMENGQILEISRNFFAFCNETSDIFYFGEETDIYKNGEIIDHEGAWRADEENCKAGILMPGRILLGARYYQEYAPGKAMDRAENISVTETKETPAGNFTGCLKTMESSGLNPKEKEYKLYAPTIGLIQDEDLLLVKYGFIK